MADERLNKTIPLNAEASLVRPTIAQDEIRIGRRNGVADTDTNSTVVSLRFSLNEYQRT